MTLSVFSVFDYWSDRVREMEFTDSASLFYRGSRLLRGSLYLEIRDCSGFLYLRSVFDAAWYNFLVPLVRAEEFDLVRAEKVIEGERARGKRVSFYLHWSLLEGYRTFLRERGYRQMGTEVYLARRIQTGNGGLRGELRRVGRDSRSRYLEMSRRCFPDWENNGEYAQYFLDLEERRKGKLYRSFLLEVEDEVVSFGAVVVGPTERLAYLHNMGTLPEYRRQGYFTEMTGHLCRYAALGGAVEAFALVEEEASSYLALSKRGFKDRQFFYLFVRDGPNQQRC